MMTSNDPQAAAELRHLLEAELSLPSRVGHVALLLASLAVTAVVGSLWLTEPALPVRTQAAFAAMTVIGLSWAGFAAAVLTRRRILFARDRIVAGRMAVTFTSVFVLGALLLGYTTGGRGPFAAAALGLVMLASAIAILVHAHRTVARLTGRRAALERELGKNAG